MQIPSSSSVPETKPAPKPEEKTYSDSEIMASIKEPPKKAEAKPAAPKPSRRTPDGKTRLWINVFGRR